MSAPHVLSASDYMAYIGRKSCGCIVAATVDDPIFKKDTAKFVAKLLRDGLFVERVSCQFVRDNMKMCNCGLAGKP